MPQGLIEEIEKLTGVSDRASFLTVLCEYVSAIAERVINALKNIKHDNRRTFE